MKKVLTPFLLILFALFLTACNDETEKAEAIQSSIDERFSIGVMIADTGLGDQSFNDLVAKGLVKARDELNIIWSYEDLSSSSTIDEGVEKLLAEEHDLIIGVGYRAQEPIEKIATNYPDQRFALIDTLSTVENVDSILFKENEGSFLAGVVAAHLSQTNVIGFVGGFEDPVILKFLEGFQEGARSVKPNMNVLVEFANTYSDDKVGATLASQMIAQQADVLYAAAGYTGVGLLQQAQKENVLAIGVDNDQYFYAENAVVTSMMKNLDIATYNYLNTVMEDMKQPQLVLELGLKEDALALAPIRVVPNAIELEEIVEDAKSSIVKE